MKLNENKELWTQRVEEFKSSNLNQTTWCEKNNIKVSSLRYWLRKLDNNSFTKPVNSSDAFEFACVSIAEDQASPAVTLEIKDVRLAITNDYDEVLLLKLIKTLKKL
ncbi:hypothetical protein KQI41_11395 [Tissierella pigra]|uniref:Transposase n=1 Tax=Tissierella pigra TaxID=2607614 RepID=A0A6N7Y0X0_9FIRM|nr:hypothetical protein [Tissierella pigra]MBU5427018.1 hypothetical protein [Tissierella pigra]MSU02385.1 hypothetical protein [Tissierella pigra]